MIRVATPVGVHLLDQATVWHAWGDDDQLVALYLEDMTPRHRTRLLAWLRERAEELQGRAMDEVARQQKRGELTDAEFAAAAEQLVGIDARTWLEERPLVRRLQEMQPRAHWPGRGLLRGRRRSWR